MVRKVKIGWGGCSPMEHVSKQKCCSFCVGRAQTCKVSANMGKDPIAQSLHNRGNACTRGSPAAGEITGVDASPLTYVRKCANAKTF